MAALSPPTCKISLFLKLLVFFGILKVVKKFWGLDWDVLGKYYVFGNMVDVFDNSAIKGVYLVL